MAAVEEEQLDPRVQIELEKLNTATDDINKLEAKLEEANNVFRTTLTESTARLKALAKKLGSCIEKARPYYEALELARSSQLDCQRAAVQYQRANALHQAAKETIALAEERFVNSRHEHWQFDSAWQEMLNHATIKVMEAEAQKAASEREHMRRAAAFTKAEQRVQQLQRGLKSSINKSLIYFEEKANVQSQLQAQKERVQQLQRAITASKTSYAQSLRSLEQISEEIHEQRRCRLPREPGVGAEITPPEPDDNQTFDHSAKTFTPLEEITAQEEKYWESLREKLEKLKVDSNEQTASAEDDASDSECLDGRERTVTGSSCTSNPELERGLPMERVVSGESSAASESDEAQSPTGGKDLCLEEILILDTTEDPELKPGSEEKCVDSQSEKVVNEGEALTSRKSPVGGDAIMVICLDDACANEIANESPTLGRTTVMAPSGKGSDTTDSDNEIGNELVQDGFKEKLNATSLLGGCTSEGVASSEENSKDAPEDAEVEEIILELDEEIGEENDGECKSSSPPPTMCQPVRGLSIIPEGIESHE
ncbi:SH3 domain-binding protein 5-like [Penaeus japonicus]|uniref:SH3 domain-binding protein 5-like n=1 Tax=Penaeus japonicus TaxID=27405 RepID=UPI001C70D882|nr:SH3 domain-binding protein 5-like [Penaeus japonicus]